jgi:hypothetical protein
MARNKGLASKKAIYLWTGSQGFRSNCYGAMNWTERGYDSFYLEMEERENKG